VINKGSNSGGGITPQIAGVVNENPAKNLNKRLLTYLYIRFFLEWLVVDKSLNH
jgi:fucose permease